ncbi:MarR family winged helix-turn-helix transcriptional regulator, partial [Xanthomonas hortorum]
RDLVVASAVKQPAMVALLDKLEAQKLIKRAPTAQDRRAALVSLTARGRKMAELGARVLIDLNADALQGFSAEEAQKTVAFMQRLIVNLEQRGADL